MTSSSDIYISVIRSSSISSHINHVSIGSACALFVIFVHWRVLSDLRSRIQVFLRQPVGKESSHPGSLVSVCAGWRIRMPRSGACRLGRTTGGRLLGSVGGVVLVHQPADYAAALVWGLLLYGLAVRTKSLTACIFAHGVANLVLGIYVLYSGHRGFW